MHHDSHTHLALMIAERRERSAAGPHADRARRVAQLRRLDRRAEQAAARARLARLV